MPPPARVARRTRRSSTRRTSASRSSTPTTMARTRCAPTYITPLAQAADQRDWLIVLVDTRHARLLHGNSDYVVEFERERDSVAGQHERGGPTDHQRWVEHEVDQHLKKVAHEVDSCLEMRRPDKLLIGPPELASRLESMLSKPASEKLAGASRSRSRRRVRTTSAAPRCRPFEESGSLRRAARRRHTPDRGRRPRSRRRRRTLPARSSAGRRRAAGRTRLRPDREVQRDAGRDHDRGQPDDSRSLRWLPIITNRLPTSRSCRTGAALR